MNDEKESTWIEQYFDIIEEIFSGEKYNEYLKVLFDTYYANKFPPYIFCLSENKDSLSQWRAYSSDGQGICIGFNTKYLDFKRDLPSQSVYAEDTLGLMDVIYNPNQQKKNIINKVHFYKGLYDERENEEFWLMSSSLLAFWLNENSLVFKNESFSEEKEWRLIHTPLQMEYEREIKRLSEINFRVSNHKIITYFCYLFDDIFSSKLIPEIVLGPKSRIDLNELELFLKNNNLKKTKILKSKSTYR